MMKKLVFSGKDKAKDDKDIKTLVDAYEERLQSKDKELADEFKFTDVKIKKRVRPNCCGMWRQLCKRNVQSIKRNPFVFRARAGQIIFMGLISIGVFWQSNGTSRKEMQNLVGAMFFGTMAMFMPAYMMTNLTFQTERPVFLREQANQMYDVMPYYLAKILSELPSFIVPPVLFSVITFFGIGYTQGVDLFFKYYLNNVMGQIAGVSCGYLISASVKN